MIETPLKGIFFAICGPSGVGKGTLINMLRKKYPQFVYPISYTTRPKRKGETNGNPYYFVSEEKFKEDIEEKFFLEWAIVHDIGFYGTSKESVLKSLEEGKIVVKEVDIQGVSWLKKKLERRNIIAIFVRPESMDILKDRIARREKMSDQELDRRMRSALMEFARIDDCNYVMVSRENEYDDFLQQLETIILKEAKKAGIDI